MPDSFDPLEPSDDPFEEPSKSQAKRDALALRGLGEDVAALSAAQRERLPMDDALRAAIEELVRIRAHGARKRQVGYVAKQLRRVDTAPIEAALEQIRQAARAQAHDHHVVEAWRDRLLGDGPAETPAQALTAFLGEYRQIDRQALRQLQQAALAERAAGRAPAAARKLFRLVRDALGAGRQPEPSD